MKNALIAAVVAAIVAAASGTAATIVVTSKNIKNGTIQSVDIAAKAKRALKGNRGPRGLAGLQGPQGLAGAQALKARPGEGGRWGPERRSPVPVSLTYVSSAVTPLPANAQATAFAVCPAGMVVTGGGGFTESTDVDVSVNSSELDCDRVGAGRVVRHHEQR